MLKEFSSVRQTEKISRRLYTDNYFDLYLWYKKNSNIFIGFQLIFCIDGSQMALTAEIDKIPSIDRVNSGDNKSYGPTDLLDSPGYLPKEELYLEFSNRSKFIDKEIRSGILKVIQGYKKDGIKKEGKLEPIYNL